MGSRLGNDTNGSVHDLPQLYSRPSSSCLLRTLEQLKIKPAAWGDPETASQYDEANLPRYLTGIVASSLAWIKEEDAREQIWEAASCRLSERSGRSALPSMSRTFNIPTSTEDAVPITLREPSLTADNLGHKTWLASYLLAKRLPSLLRYIPGLQNGAQAIELGAGTGLVGIAIAAMFDVHVHLTDLSAIVPNLLANTTVNSPNVAKGSTSVGEFDWSTVSDHCGKEHKAYDVVVAADPLYSPQHPAWLVAAIDHVLKRDARARVVIELPLREAYAPEIAELKVRMEGLDLTVLAEGTESGIEDWEDNHPGNERTQVMCWWAVWQWIPSTQAGLRSTQGQMLQSSDTQAKSADTSFPFEKLPTELQLMILRFTMPQHGLRAFSSPLPMHDPAYESARQARLEELQQEDTAPTGVFRTNRSISAQALHIFNSEVYLHINPTMRTINCLREEHYCGSFLCQVSPRQSHILGSVSNVQINLGSWLGATEIDFGIVQMDAKRSYRLLKETLRQICDAMTGNPNLQRLIVTLPCHCFLMNIAQPATQLLAYTLDYLTPLRRLCVAHTINLLPTAGFGSSPEVVVCRRPACSHLANTIQTQFTRLSGEELTCAEEKWKQIKAIANFKPNRNSVEIAVITFWQQLLADNHQDFKKIMDHTLARLQ
ncbi:MAG: hypothetical protein Q9176_004024 [Flavoplaca citrina]